MKLTEWLYKLRKPVEVNDEELQRIEARIQETLIVLEPKTAFINNLRERLVGKFPKMESAISEPGYPAYQTGLLVTSGIIGSILVIFTGIRSLVSLIAVGGLLISLLKQNTQEVYIPSDLTTG